MHRNFLTLFLLGLFFISPVMAMEERIAAVVDDDVITASEVNDRVSLIILSSGLKNAPENRARLLPQVIRDLIDEQLKIQEAERLDVLATQNEISNGFKIIAGQNNMDPAQFQTLLDRAGVNKATMERQIRAQISWQKAVQKGLRPKISVTESDVKNELARLQQNIGETEYLAAEIYLPFETPGDAQFSEQNIRELAYRLVGEIKQGAPFGKVAQQFSKSAGAPQGGNLGWVQETQLAEELGNSLAGMEKGDVSEPVRSLTGYHILLLRDKRTITEESIPNEEDLGRSMVLERLERTAARHLMDLRAAAFIETRV